MKKEKKYTKRFKVNYWWLAAFLLGGLLWSWLDSDSFIRYGVMAIIILIFQPIMNYLIIGHGNGAEVKMEPAQNKSNVNENIAKYKAMLKKRKENAKWWQFWL